jgi:hypothetical protein
MGADRSPEPRGLRPWHLFLLAGLAASTAAVALTRDTRPANLVMLSITILSAIGVAVAFQLTLAPFGEQSVEGEPQGLSARARAALEREKMLVLRSIKELEFDRAMGKIADGDFAEMVARLRARAITLMQQLDREAAGYRGLIERDVEARLAAMGFGGAVAPAANGQPAPPQTRPGLLACASCGTTNDHDARFCKSCGAKLDAYAVSR